MTPLIQLINLETAVLPYDYGSLQCSFPGITTSPTRLTDRMICWTSSTLILSSTTSLARDPLLIARSLSLSVILAARPFVYHVLSRTYIFRCIGSGSIDSIASTHTILPRDVLLHHRKPCIRRGGRYIPELNTLSIGPTRKHPTVLRAEEYKQSE